MAKTKSFKRSRIKRVPKNCFFDKEKKEPSFKDITTLQKFLTERGKITPRSRNGLCSKHQSALARQVKYARHLALLPFIVKD